MKIKIFAANLAMITTAIFITAVTILAEIFPALKTQLILLTGHHWLTKVVLATILFITVLAFSSLLKIKKTLPILKISIITSWLSVLIIFAFFIWNY